MSFKPTKLILIIVLIGVGAAVALPFTNTSVLAPMRDSDLGAKLSKTFNQPISEERLQLEIDQSISNVLSDLDYELVEEIEVEIVDTQNIEAQIAKLEATESLPVVSRLETDMDETAPKAQITSKIDAETAVGIVQRETGLSADELNALIAK